MKRFKDSLLVRMQTSTCELIWELEDTMQDGMFSTIGVFLARDMRCFEDEIWRTGTFVVPGYTSMRSEPLWRN